MTTAGPFSKAGPALVNRLSDLVKINPALVKPLSTVASPGFTGSPMLVKSSPALVKGRPTIV